MRAVSGTDLSLFPTQPPSHAAFLRAVNVGKHNRVRMVEVRDAIAGLGYGDVRTYLPTGNVALRATEGADVVAERIEGALAALGLRDVDVMVRTRDDLLALDGGVFEPYPVDEFRRMAIFTRQRVAATVSLPLEIGSVTVLAAGAALLAVMPKHAEPPVNVNAAIEKAWKTRATTRWWNVVEDFRRDILA
jgi:uncharacterized protein (DUF1697 family)